MPPVCDEWSTLKRLGKEREVVGIYLSSHPLDDYKPVIDQFCNATITDVNEMEKNVGKELAFACVTISGEERTTTDGKYQFGVLVVEDYTDKYEFRLRRKDFERFRHFLHPDYYLLIRGEVKSFVTYDKDDIHQLNPKTRNFFSISSMTQLNDVVDGIQQLILYLDVDQISEDFVEELLDKTGLNKKIKKAEKRIKKVCGDYDIIYHRWGAILYLVFAVLAAVMSYIVITGCCCKKQECAVVEPEAPAASSDETKLA
jgi:DNA polymerase-3 subunit alpha